jgi:hypothetical protein
VNPKLFSGGKHLRFGTLLVTLIISALLVACFSREPIRLGFLGGLSGRVADLGIGGRDGALLAIELRNASGGVGGRLLELIAEDDQQDTETAKRAVSRLINNKVVATIGPMTSAMAVATVPLANTTQRLMVTTPDLVRMDDYFLRVIDSEKRIWNVLSARLVFLVCSPLMRPTWCSDGMAARTSGQTLKKVILERREFAGAQSLIRFDAYGDATRDSYLTTVCRGAFVRLV